jgi:hypothetical protein
MVTTLRDLNGNTAYTPPANQTVAVLSDGRAVALIKDSGNLGNLYLYRSNLARTAWSLDATVPLAGDLSPPYGYAFCVDASDRIHVIYERTQPFHTDVYHFRLTTPGTWTKSGEEEVFDFSATKHPGCLAIDFLTGTNTLFAAALFKDLDDSSKIKIRHKVRHSGAAWAGQTDHTITGGNSELTYLSVCRDIAGADGSNLQRVAIAAASNGAATLLAVARVNVTNGVQDSWTVVDSSAMGGNTAKFRTVGVYPYGNTDWAMVGQTGAGSATTTWAARFNGSAYVVNPVSASSVYSSNGPETSYLDRTVGYTQGHGFTAWRVQNANTTHDFIYGQIARFDSGSTTIGERFVWKRNNSCFGVMSGTGKVNYDEGFADVLTQVTDRDGPIIAYFNPDPLTPTNLSPTSTTTTDTPTLSMRASAFNPSGLGGDESGARVYPEFTLARDSGFTVDTRTVIGDKDSDLILVGTKQLVVPSASQLDQDTWYMRGRDIDEWGQVSPWATTVSFVVTHPPSSTGHLPTGAASYAFSATNDFSWVFSDPSPLDFQTAYRIEITEVSDFSVVEDTGKVLGDETTVAIAVDGSHTETLLQWRVKLWDSDDVEGAWSDYHLFYLRTAPTVALTSPADPFETPQPTIQWTFTPSNGRPQTQWQVYIIDESTDEEVYARAGSGNGTSHVVDNGSILQNSNDYTFGVRVYDSSGMAATDELTNVTSGWDPPDQPAITVNTANFEEDGYVRITWTDASEDAEFDSYRVYRKDEESTDWVLLAETFSDETSYTYDDYLAPSGIQVTYAVVQVAIRFDARAESLYTDQDQTVTPSGSHYWLIDPEDSANSFPLRIVTSDEFVDDEYEEEEYHVLGLGRATERGDRLGVKGTLTVQLRGTTGVSARTQRIQIKELKAEGRAMYLRSPFGDLYRINMGEVGVSRVAGVGLSEYVDVSLPYSELSGAL